MKSNHIVLMLLAGLVLVFFGHREALGAETNEEEKASFPTPEEILPPVNRFDGKSRELAVPKDHPWSTPAEQTELQATPRYDETVAWLRRLVSVSPELRMVSIGESAEGRELVMIIACRDQAFTADGLHRTGKPIVLAQACIHAGEVDGKDAGMMLLRDITVRGTKKELLDGANFLFVPIFNVDGHERFSAFSRVNQRGPKEMGWRTTARNLNLNRDYGKIDTQEMRAMIVALQTWRPHLYLDLHVTDGADYQYDITFGYNGRHGASPAIAQWFDEHLTPWLNRDLEAMGHTPGPLVFAMNPTDMSRGIVGWTASSRYSNGYGDIAHLPTVLVENHSLKPYDQRVLGTYVLLESCLRAVARDFGGLRRAIEADRKRRSREVVLKYGVAPDRPPRTIDFKGIESRMRTSEITKGKIVEWLGKPVEQTVPYFVADHPTEKVTRPKAYWIPPVWSEVIDRLAVHGVEMERLESAMEVEVDLLKILEPELAKSVFEGRVRVSAKFETMRSRQHFPKGSMRVSTDQPLGDLVVHLLEPTSEDSFFQWGFFLEVLQRTEYIESYALGPLAEQMLAADPELREEFHRKVEAEPDFAANGRRRLQWFYSRSPYFDERYLVYPVGRE